MKDARLSMTRLGTHLRKAGYSSDESSEILRYYESNGFFNSNKQRKSKFLTYVKAGIGKGSRNVINVLENQIAWHCKGYSSILRRLPDGVSTSDQLCKDCFKIYDEMETREDVLVFLKFLRNIECYDNIESAFNLYKRMKAAHPSIVECCNSPQVLAAFRNISHEEAQKRVASFRAHRILTLDGFIARHGEEVGREKFKHFQETSAKATTVAREKYGDDFFKNKSWASRKHYEGSGMSEDEITRTISDLQHKRSGLYREHYELKGMSVQEVDERLAEIDKAKGNTPRDLVHSAAQIGKQAAIDKYFEVILKSRHTKGCIPLSDDFFSYRFYVDKYTSVALKLFPSYIQGIEFKDDPDYSLDHVYSKKEGFENGIPPSLIGNAANLRYVPRAVNSGKGDRSDITVEELVENAIRISKNEGM